LDDRALFSKTAIELRNLGNIGILPLLSLQVEISAFSVRQLLFWISYVWLNWAIGSSALEHNANEGHQNSKIQIIILMCYMSQANQRHGYDGCQLRIFTRCILALHKIISLDSEQKKLILGNTGTPLCSRG